MQNCAVVAGDEVNTFGHISQIGLTCRAIWKSYCTVHYFINQQFYCGAKKTCIKSSADIINYGHQGCKNSDTHDGRKELGQNKLPLYLHKARRYAERKGDNRRKSEGNNGKRCIC
jgi:hypothetical protein